MNLILIDKRVKQVANKLASSIGATTSSWPADRSGWHGTIWYGRRPGLH